MSYLLLPVSPKYANIPRSTAANIASIIIPFAANSPENGSPEIPVRLVNAVFTVGIIAAKTYTISVIVISPPIIPPKLKALNFDISPLPPRRID